jgi:hypothetical protein
LHSVNESPDAALVPKARILRDEGGSGLVTARRFSINTGRLLRDELRGLRFAQPLPSSSTKFSITRASHPLLLFTGPINEADSTHVAVCIHEALVTLS